MYSCLLALDQWLLSISHCSPLVCLVVLSKGDPNALHDAAWPGVRVGDISSMKNCAGPVSSGAGLIG